MKGVLDLVSPGRDDELPGFGEVSALAVLGLGRCDLYIHLLLQRATNEPADRVSLPIGLGGNRLCPRGFVSICLFIQFPFFGSVLPWSTHSSLSWLLFASRTDELEPGIYEPAALQISCVADPTEVHE